MSPFSCPSCGQEQPHGKDDCVKCGIIFSKWQERQARIQSAPRLATAPVAYRSSFDRLVAVLPKFLLLTSIPVGIWLYVKAPAGLPVPAGAYIDKEYHFALSKPEGWKINAERTFRDGNSEVLVLTKEGGGDIPNRLVVVVSASWASDLRKNVRERMSKLVGAVFPGMTTEFKLESEGIVELDRMEVLKVSGHATKTVSVAKTRFVEAPKPRFQPYSPYNYSPSRTPAAPALENYTENEMHELYFAVYVVPGAERSYLVGLIGEAASVKSQMKPLEEMVYSFRVLERAFSWPHLTRILSGEFKQEALLLFLGFMVGFYRWVFSDFIE